MSTCFPCYISPSKISSLIGPENTDVPGQGVEGRGKINEGLIKEPSVSSCSREIAAERARGSLAPAPSAPARAGRSAFPVLLFQLLCVRGLEEGGGRGQSGQGRFSVSWEPASFPRFAARRPWYASRALSP